MHGRIRLGLIIFSCAALLLASTGVAGQDVGGDEVSISIEAWFTCGSDTRAAKLFVKAELGAGSYVSSLKQKPPHIPTQIRLDRSEQFRLLEGFTPASEPSIVPHAEGLLEKHTGEVIWSAPIRLSHGVNPSSLAIAGKLDGQICNQQTCHPLANLDNTFTARLRKTVAAETDRPETLGPETLGPGKGALVIVGGGGGTHQSRILGRFIELAGGEQARIVVVPTAASSSEQYDYANHRMAGRIKEHYKVKRVTIVHTHDRKLADTAAFVDPIRQATGVWFSGGRQWRLTKAYRGTRTEKAFHDVLRRGGAIGGSSAGATIQGSFLARGDTRGNSLMIGDFQHGFAFLQNVAIDQHVVPRRRQPDMIRLLEDPQGRMKPEFDRAALLGLGIDEDTAIVVRGNTFEVIGKPDGAVFVYDPRKWSDDTPDDKKYLTLRRGAKYDVKQRKLLEAGGPRQSEQPVTHGEDGDRKSDSQPIESAGKLGLQSGVSYGIHFGTSAP